MFDGRNNKFEAWTEAFENMALISGQNAIFIALSKLTGSPLSTNLKRNYPCNILLFYWTQMQPMLSPIYLKVQWDGGIEYVCLLVYSPMLIPRQLRFSLYSGAVITKGLMQ